MDWHFTSNPEQGHWFREDNAFFVVNPSRCGSPNLYGRNDDIYLVLSHLPEPVAGRGGGVHLLAEGSTLQEATEKGMAWLGTLSEDQVMRPFSTKSKAYWQPDIERRKALLLESWKKAGKGA